MIVWKVFKLYLRVFGLQYIYISIFASRLQTSFRITVPFRLYTRRDRVHTVFWREYRTALEVRPPDFGG